MCWLRHICLILLISALCLTGAQGNASAEQSYDGAAAARWALSHAQDVQPNFPGCTWFASQALWAGGMEQDDYWNTKNLVGGLKNGNWGTRTATLAQDLYAHLKYNGRTLVLPLAGRDAQYDRFLPGKNAVPEARPGDLIAYDWEGDGAIDHMSVVVHISPGDYPDVAEWGVNEDPGTRSSYVQRGWTWSAIRQAWLRKRYPHVVAYLLRIAV